MRYLLITLTVLMGAVCTPVSAAQPREQHCSSPLPSSQDREALQASIYEYLQLSEQSLAMRSEAIQLYQELKARRNTKAPLSGHDLQRLSEGAAALLENREALFTLALSHECWTLSPPPEDQEAAQMQRAGVLASLSAALVLYDNYLSAISLYYNDPTLRQHLNQADVSQGINRGELNSMAQTFADPEKRDRVRKAIQWYEDYGRVAQTSQELEGYDYLVQSIEQSPSYRLLKKRRPLKEMATHFDVFSQGAVDTLFGLKNESTNLVSALFGNTVGLVEARRGKLDSQPEIRAQVAQTLRAGDILLEKTPFRLTDTFIPGYWGHAAIWIGTEPELRELGIWDHPAVQPHQARIREGHGVVEALRSGVELNTLEHFMNIDDLAVLRQTPMADEQRAKVIIYSLNQLGKRYDFNFDAETTQKIFCSKLVYLAYGELPWPTTRFLGKTTVSPDNISALAMGNGPLEPVLVFLNGEQVKDPSRDMMERLVRDESEKLLQLSSKSTRPGSWKGLPQENTQTP